MPSKSNDCAMATMTQHQCTYQTTLNLIHMKISTAQKKPRPMQPWKGIHRPAKPLPRRHSQAIQHSFNSITDFDETLVEVAYRSPCLKHRPLTQQIQHICHLLRAGAMGWPRLVKRAAADQLQSRSPMLNQRLPVTR